MKSVLTIFSLLLISLTAAAQNQTEETCLQTAKKAAQAIAQLNNQSTDLVYETKTAGANASDFLYRGVVKNSNIVYKVGYIFNGNECVVTSVNSELTPVY